MDANVIVNNPIAHFETLSNNPFIFASSMLAFFDRLGAKKQSLLLAYLVLPVTLQGERRKFLVNSNVKSSLRSMLGKKGIFNGLAEMVEDYKAITNTTLQYLLSAGAIEVIGSELKITGRFEGHESPAPQGLVKAATAFAGFVSPYEVPMVYRMLGILSL